MRQQAGRQASRQATADASFPSLRSIDRSMERLGSGEPESDATCSVIRTTRRAFSLPRAQTCATKVAGYVTRNIFVVAPTHAVSYDAASLSEPPSLASCYYFGPILAGSFSRGFHRTRHYSPYFLRSLHHASEGANNSSSIITSVHSKRPFVFVRVRVETACACAAGRDRIRK